MKLKKTNSGKISIQFSYSDYAAFCTLISQVVDVFSQYNKTSLNTEADVVDRIYYLELMHLHKRLSKADTYPFNSHCQKKEKVTINLESQEALVVWYYTTQVTHDTYLISLLRLHLHKQLI